MSYTYNGIFLSNADGTLEEYANNLGGGRDVDTSILANKTDISSIILVGSTNTTSETITAGTWFYLNGTPCVAKVDIASGATFTKDTNYEEKTIGSALSELNDNTSSLSEVYTNAETFAQVTNSSGNTLDARYTTYIAPILETLFSESSGTFVKTGQDGIVLTGMLAKESNGGDIAGFAVEFDGYYYLFRGINRTSPKYRWVRQLNIRN